MDFIYLKFDAFAPIKKDNNRDKFKPIYLPSIMNYSVLNRRKKLKP